MKATVIDEPTFIRIEVHASNACIGGNSQVRSSAARGGTLSEDQLVGQLGEFALARFLGNEEAYFERRRRQDLVPLQGDGGYDFGALPVDVKCSLMRYSADPRRYRLPVRPRERHAGWKYVAAFVDKTVPPLTVFLAGWTDDSLLKEAESEGTFKGAFTTPVPNLLSMRVLKSNLRQ